MELYDNPPSNAVHRYIRPPPHCYLDVELEIYAADLRDRNRLDDGQWGPIIDVKAVLCQECCIADSDYCSASSAGNLFQH